MLGKQELLVKGLLMVQACMGVGVVYAWNHRQPELHSKTLSKEESRGLERWLSN